MTIKSLNFKAHLLDPRISTYLGYLTFGVSAFALFILSIQTSESILLLKRALFLMVPSLLGFHAIKTKKSLWLFWVLLAGSLIHYLFSRRIDVLSEFVLVSWILFFKDLKLVKPISKNLMKGIGLALCAIVCVHFYFFEMYNRESIGGLDPNYSSFIIFLLLPIAIFSRSLILHGFILILGILTQSRGFFLAAVVFYSSLVFFRYSTRWRFDFKHYLIVIFFSFIVLLIYSYYGYVSGFESYGGYSEGLGRLLHIFNNSADFDRWKANIIFIQHCFSNLNLLFLGMEPSEYQKNINPFLPHNIILLELSTHGIILGLGFLYAFYCALKNVFTVQYFAFFIGILIYWFFLGIEIGAVYNVFMFCILKFILVDEPLES